MRPRVLVIAACVAWLASAPSAQAQVYKWVDDQGVVNYSSTPPPKGRSAVTLDADKGRVTTIPAPDARREAAAPGGDAALRQRIDQLERDAAAQRQAASQQDAAAAEAARRWREQCLAERRVDCDDAGRGVFDPGYGYVYPPYARPPIAAPSPAAPGTYRPTPYVVQGGGGVVGPYYRSPPGGTAIGSGSYGIGGGYVPAPPGGVVLGPGTGGVGAQYYPVPESSAPPPPSRPRPQPRAPDMPR
jgi:hypothetical protein